MGMSLTIAATSEVEVMGMMRESCEGVWTVEPKPLKKPQVMVARAIVVPQDGNVPMRMLNMDHQPVIIDKGTKIALTEAVDNIREASTVNEKQRSTLTEQEREEVLSNVLSTMPETLTDHELKQFFF